MFQKIESFMNKILPDFDRDTAKREEATRKVAESSKATRSHIDKTIFEAYRDAGIVFSHTKKKGQHGL